MEKKAFLNGLLCGIVLMCLVAVGVVFARGAFSGLGSPSSHETGNSAEHTNFEARVVEKMQMLRSYIDAYFLYDSDEDAMLDAICSGIMDSLGDPYSVYYNQEQYSALMESTSGTYYGIGVQVQQDASTKQAVILNVFDGTPAKESGLLEGDIFIKVGDTDVTSMELEEMVSLIKGEEGTKVHITVYRSSVEDYLEFDVERRKIETETVAYEMLENGIGYIIVAEFDEVTEKQFDDAYKALSMQGMKGLIIDLRSNPGGLLSTVTHMCDKFLDEGMIVYTEDKNGKRNEYTSDAAAETIPLVVLVNGGSASASEIFAGAMQDRNRATIVGTTTFGKGIVQTIVPLRGDDGDAIKITISSYFTPNGVCIHGIGIQPDVVEELNEELYSMPEITLEDDNQLQKAIEVMLEKIGKGE